MTSTSPSEVGARGLQLVGGRVEALHALLGLGLDAPSRPRTCRVVDSSSSASASFQAASASVSKVANRRPPARVKACSAPRCSPTPSPAALPRGLLSSARSPRLASCALASAQLRLDRAPPSRRARWPPSPPCPAPRRSAGPRSRPVSARIAESGLGLFRLERVAQLGQLVVEAATLVAPRRSRAGRSGGGLVHVVVDLLRGAGGGGQKAR